MYIYIYVCVCVCVCVCVYIYIYIYIYIYSKMVDYGESDKMMKIIGKVDKSDSYEGFSCKISFFI